MTNLWMYREDTFTDGTDVVGYDVAAADGDIGKVDQSSQATDSAHLVVDTGWWIFGKKRLIPAGAVSGIDHRNQRISVDMTKDEIKDAPDFDETVQLDETNRSDYDRYYTPFGW
jgi:hypothetical protein